MSKPFALFDRDGTLIVEKNYLSNPDQLELIPGAGDALRRLKAEGWGICLVTNQSGIARGYFDLEQVRKVHERLSRELALLGVELDGIYICPHSPLDVCQCRKPLRGMIDQAIAAHDFDPRDAWVIGDKEADIGLAHAVGARSVLVRTGYGKSYESETKANFVADDVTEAVNFILESRNPEPEQD